MITSNKTKHLLTENQIKKIEKFDATYFRGKNYFDGDGIQNYLVFQPVYKYFKIGSNKISSWESKGWSNEKISFFPQLRNNQPPSPAYNNARIKILFSGDFSRQDKVAYNHGPVVRLTLPLVQKVVP